MAHVALLEEHLDGVLGGEDDLGRKLAVHVDGGTGSLRGGVGGRGGLVLLGGDTGNLEESHGWYVCVCCGDRVELS